MSITLNSGSQRPAPAPLTPTPPFPKEGLLPRTSEDVALNYRTQYRPKLLAAYAAKRAAKAAGETYTGPPCINVLNITLCFDGTNNHEPSDKLGQPPSTSNVARLYHASVGADSGTEQSRPNQMGFYRYYMQGVGTEFKEIGEFEPQDLGLIGAVGGENRINWGITRLLDAVGRACGEPYLDPGVAYELVQKMGTSFTEEMLGATLLKSGDSRRREALQAPLLALQKKVDFVHVRKTQPRIIGLRLYVYGFSRGAAEARAFATWLESLTQVEVEGETCYLFAGLPICIAFLGLFDTVASTGMAYAMPFAEGHMGWADDSMRLPDSETFLERCVHLVAAHEQRVCFPVDSIRRKSDPDDPNGPSTYRTNTVEYLYPGMHSDVGGGYSPGDQGKSLGGPQDVMSQLPLQHMYAEAYAVGAPLQAPSIALSDEQRQDEPWLEMAEEVHDAFDVSETLTHRFNTWLAHHKTGPLEDALAGEQALLTGWRINRYGSFHFRTTSAYQHVTGKDMTQEEWDALKALHERQLAENKANHEGQPLKELSGSTLATHQEYRALKQGYEQRVGAAQPIDFNTHKAFEPTLDQRQMDRAMIEFGRDYDPSNWSLALAGDAISWATIPHLLFGGLIYLTNEQDEAQEYRDLRTSGNQAYLALYDLKTAEPLTDTARTLTDFFDEQVHDSRAWFMNSTRLGEREVFSDYFRYRCIFFDSESNKSLSPVARAGQVIGVGIAVASVGLSIKRHDPRYLVGLLIPSLGIPVFRGKVGFPEVSAFDSVTGIALPMLDNLDNIRAFSKDPGDMLKLVKALPTPPALSAETATTPELQKLLKATEAAKALAKVKDLLDQLPDESKMGLLDQVKGALGSGVS
ncbi:MAG: T6SS phospholipase effector Tle1-like catalytic domain-containing protein [Pseudomonas sp.]